VEFRFIPDGFMLGTESDSFDTSCQTPTQGRLKVSVFTVIPLPPWVIKGVF